MPSREPRVVLDTDVASKLWRDKLDQPSQQKLVGMTLVLTYITIAEWWQWAHHRGWGQAKIGDMRRYAGNFELLWCDNEVVKAWGRLSGLAMKAGVTVPGNDCLDRCVLHRPQPPPAHPRRRLQAAGGSGAHVALAESCDLAPPPMQPHRQGPLMRSRR
jgi:predicted nucleic acid-binding protein